MTCALVVTAGVSRADDPTPPPTVEQSFEEPLPPVDQAAPWLRPWLPPAAGDPNPILADGHEVSIQAGMGVLLSKFSSVPATLTLSGEYGRFLRSSKRQALSIEAVGDFNITLDRVTPQFGALGVGLRRVGRRSGVSFGSVDYERISIGPAFMSRGSNLDVGVQAELALGVLTFKGAGLGLFLNAYFFEPAQMFGPDSLLLVGLGYVHCPVTGLRSNVATVTSVREPRSEPSAHPCPQLAAYQAAIKQARMLAVQMCNGSDLQACEVARARVLSLNTQLSACEQGEAVAPPTEDDAAPVH